VMEPAFMHILLQKWHWSRIELFYKECRSLLLVFTALALYITQDESFIRLVPERAVRRFPGEPHRYEEPGANSTKNTILSYVLYRL
jgi:hypothetical protein